MMAVTGSTLVPDAASMTALPSPFRLALTAWVTPEMYTRPVPDEPRMTVPTLPLRMMSPVLPQGNALMTLTDFELPSLPVPFTRRTDSSMPILQLWTMLPVLGEQGAAYESEAPSTASRAAPSSVLQVCRCALLGSAKGICTMHWPVI